MDWRVLNRIRHIKGRNPKGYGLPSLVVVLFFVSVLVQAIISTMVRETTEGKAEAAFNITKEHLDTFKITGGAPDAPHISDPTRLLTSSYTGAASNPMVEFDFIDPNKRAQALYAQKLRAYVNIPNAEALGQISRDRIRPEYPERIRRSGDRMTTSIETQNISGIDVVNMGTGMSEDVEVVTLTGVASTLIDTPRIEATRVTSAKVNISSDLTTQDMNISSSLIAEDVNLGSLTVDGSLSGNDVLFQEVLLSGQLATSDALSNVTDLSFEQITAEGIRVGETHSDTFEVNTVTGGSPAVGTFD